ncbi:hypothetical protein ACXVUM_06520 [Williamsia sp. SKLECPSW1]
MTDAHHVGVLRVELRGARHDNDPLPDWYDGLTLVFYSADGTEHILLQEALELDPLLEWLDENEHYIRNEQPYVPQRPGETISQTRHRVGANKLLGEDHDFDDLFRLVEEANWSYHSHHYINLGFNVGTDDLPKIYIGPGLDGVEVCNYIENDNDTAWRYLFDVDDFFATLPREKSTPDQSKA